MKGYSMANLKNKLMNILPWIFLGVGLYIIYTQFAHYAKAVPLAGDDWGYAYNGANGNPLQLAFDMYFSWSGRFFAELWGFAVAKNKQLWNVLNPLLFVGVSLLTIITFGKKEHMIVNLCILFFGIFSVSTTLRLETYAWIMGSTYVTALLALLLHFLCLKQLIFTNKYQLVWLIVSSISCFFTGLAMENAAAVCLISNIVAFIYLIYLKDKSKSKMLLIPLIISLIAIIILRASPGASYRLTVDNVEFNQLSLLAKISINWPNFLYYTFFDSPWIILLMHGLLLLICVEKAIKSKSKWDWLSAIYYLLGMGITLSNNIYNATNINFFKMFYDVLYSRSAMVIVTLYYIGFVALSTYHFLHFKNNQLGIMALFTLLMAGIANGVMLISPIFGARSSIYTVYLLIGLCLVLIQCINLKFLLIPIALATLLFAYKKINYLDLVYDQVALRSEERAIQIEYYQTHLDEDIHITRYRKNTVHSADIEYGDEYHFKMFKLYYGFDLNRKVIFESLPNEVQ